MRLDTVVRLVIDWPEAEILFYLPECVFVGSSIPFAVDCGTDFEYVTGEKIEPIAVAFSGSALSSVKVTGLPSGLKYDSKTGKITGVATRAGLYTVTLTVTEGREKYVSTFTVEVEALPDWVVGTFEGYVDGVDDDGGDWVDWLFLTVSSTGKVSYKDLTEDTSIHAVKPGDIDFIRNDEGGYSVVIEQLGKDWYRKDVLKISEHEIDGVLLFPSVDTSNGSVDGSDVTVGDYLLEVD